MSRSFVTAAVALLGASQAAAHMIMATPVPFGTPDNSPLSSSGSNFPCKISGSAETFYSRSAATNNTMAVGETKTLSFTGSAVHGGGSCQLAITSDLQPSSSTTWQVIQSIEGGCPTTDGSGPSTYDYSIPESVAAGEYVFAWTWISKESGAPEYYMNCAPITVTASTTKRDDELLVRDDSTLPNLFVANLDSINDCKTTTGTDPLYPDPGPNVSKPSTMTTNYQSPSGTDCFPLGASSNSSDSGSSSSASSASSATPATSSSAATAETATSTTATTASTNAVTSASSNSGGVFVTIATSSATNTAKVTATTSTTSASSVSVTPVSTAGTNSTSTTGGNTLSGSCTNEGIFNCVGGTQYQQCASGSWTTLQDMPAGTACTVGESSTLWSRAWGGRRMRRVRRIL